MIGEQYKIKRIALAETIHRKRDLWTFIEPSLRIKKENSDNMSGPGHARGEMYTKMLDSLLTR